MTKPAFNQRNILSPFQFGRRGGFGPSTKKMSGTKVSGFPASPAAARSSRSKAGIARNPRAGKMYHHAGKL